MRESGTAGVVLATALVVASLAATAAGSLQGNLETSEPVILSGNASTAAGHGLDARWSGGGPATLSADRISVKTEYQEGIIVRTGAASYRQVDDEGKIHRNLTAVNASFEPWTSGGEALALPTNGSVDTTGEANGRSRLATLPPDTLLASAGYAGPRAGAGEGFDPAYEARTSKPLVVHEDLAAGTVEGSFRLYVNNLTINASGSEQTLDDFAGYRERQTGPGTVEYELRVTVIEVHDGHLTVTVPGEIGVLGDAPQTRVDGQATFARASGQLGVGGDRVRLSEARLALQGTGNLQVSASEAAGPGQAVGLVANVSGSFEVAEGPARASGVQARDPSPGPSTTWWTAGLVGIALVSAGGVARSHPSLIRPLPSRLREPLYRRWRRKARALEDERAFARAARFYHRMHALFPQRGIGWYWQARALLEAGRPEDAIQTVDAARDKLEVVPLDLLEVKVAACQEAGDEATARATFEDLEARSPEVARGLAKDLQLPWGQGGETTGNGDEDREGGLKGYV